ncbi:type II toxin-antitoxin system VapC family toxin [soil metagenome]
MSYLLDTDTVSAYLRRPGSLSHRFNQYSGRMAVSTMTLAELFAWAYGKPDPSATLEAIRELQTLLKVLDFEPASSETYGRLRVELRRRGQNVAPPDLIISATALTHGLTVVTHNTAHFAKIPGLSVEDWLQP